MNGDDEIRAKKKFNRKEGKEILKKVNEIIGSFDQGHIPLRIRSLRKS